jgi:ketosteroid isomerase-like protein
MQGRPWRRSWMLIAILCVLLVAHVLLRLYLPSWQNYAHAEAESSVRKMLDEQVAAWNRGNLEEFMKGYWNSPDLRFYSKNGVTSGWEGTIQRYRKAYQSEGEEMGQLTFSDLEIKPLGADTAWARGHWKVVTSKKTSAGLFTLIWRRMPEGWRIIHDHTSVNDPPPSTALESKKGS